MLICDICGAEIDAFVSAYANVPFIDGKKHEAICLCCNEVPKTFDYNSRNNTMILYSDISRNNLNSVAYLVSEGFSEADARTSLRAVKKSLARPGNLKIITNKIILDKIFLEFSI